MKKIVFITTRNLIPTDAGDKVLSLNIIKKLSQYNKVSLINVLDVETNNDSYIKIMNEYVDDVYIINPLPISYLSTLVNTVLLCPYMIAKRKKRDIFSKINSLLFDKFNEHIVIWDHLRSSAFIGRKTKAHKFILIEHNNEVAIIENMIKHTNIFFRPFLQIQKKLMKHYLKRLYEKIDRVVYVSSFDVNPNLESEKYYLLNNLPIEFNYSNRQFDNKRRTKILFVGSLDWFPNIRGIKWFVVEVMPLLKDLNIEFYIVGRNPSLEIYDLVSNNIYLHENVPSVETFYQNADIFIAPIFDGAGINIKLLEALSFNIPIVTTSFALRGYKGLSFLNPIDEPLLFKEQIIKLLTDDNYYKSMNLLEHEYYKNYIHESINELNQVVNFI